MKVLRNRGGKEEFFPHGKHIQVSQWSFLHSARHCGKGGGCWAGGKAKIQPGMDLISKSLRESYPWAFPNLRFNQASGHLLGAPPTKSSVWVNEPVLSKKIMLLLLRNFQKFPVLSGSDILRALRTLFCVMSRVCSSGGYSIIPLFQVMFQWDYSFISWCIPVGLFLYPRCVPVGLFLYSRVRSRGLFLYFRCVLVGLFHFSFVSGCVQCGYSFTPGVF